MNKLFFFKKRKMSHSTCVRCSSIRIMNVIARTRDSFMANGVSRNGKCWKYRGYVPNFVGDGGGDEFYISYCMDCGQVRNDNFPMKESSIETGIPSDEEAESSENE